MTAGSPNGSVVRAGERVGEWVVQSCIGRGGLGEVWLARHLDMEAEFAAVKFPTEPSFLDALRHEGKLLSRLKPLRHPGIVGVLGSDLHAEKPYLLMEYVPGVNLRQYLNHHGRLSADVATRILLQVLGALECAHRAGLVHRDIKPENILLHEVAVKDPRRFASQGTVKVTDFGVGTATQAAAMTLHQQSIAITGDPKSLGGVQGTLDYMAPEQREGGDGVDGRADLFACGITLFEMLVGRRPQPFEVPGDLVPGIARQLDEAFMRSYAPLDRRYASAAEFAEDLTRRAGPAGPGGTRRPRRRLRLRVVGFAAAAAFVVTAVLSLLEKPTGTPTTERPSRSRPIATPGMADLQQRAAGVDTEEESPDTRVLRRAADQGDANAQFSLGLSYANGHGVAKDEAQAVTWYRRAAYQGSAEAQAKLGLMHTDGHGVVQDNVQAVAWFRKAAYQGNAMAQYNLGAMYARGLGVRKSDAQALTWFLKAAYQGDGDAQFSIGAIYQNGQGVRRDDGQASIWYRRAADQGHAMAQTNLGWMYANGSGVPRDDTQAAAWFRKAAEQGLADAQNHLGVMYVTGRGVAQDDAQATAWFRKAAEQGDADAQFNLGLTYMNGRGVVQDDARAIAWFRKAAEQGQAGARAMLDQMGEPSGR